MQYSLLKKINMKMLILRSHQFEAAEVVRINRPDFGEVPLGFFNFFFAPSLF
jgi:hypothetical protein